MEKYQVNPSEALQEQLGLSERSLNCQRMDHELISGPCFKLLSSGLGLGLPASAEHTGLSPQYLHPE